MNYRSVQKLRGLKETLERIVFVDHAKRGGRAEEYRRWSLLLLRTKALFEAEEKRPILVVVSGGTNVGKSTIFNQLAGTTASFVSPLARGTKCPVAWGEEATLKALIRSPFVPGVDVAWDTKTAGDAETDTPTMVLVPAERDLHKGLVIIDSPDLDSDHTNNRVWAERLLTMSDAIIFVVTPEKYNDAVVIEFLAKAASLRRSLAIVFNKADSDASFDDFSRNILRPLDRNASLIRQDILRDERALAQPLPDLRQLVLSWTTSSRNIKIRALEGSLSVLSTSAKELLGLFWEEQSRLAELHEGMANAVASVVENYQAQLEGERFEELDLVFKRLLADLHIPIIDDFYGGVKAVSSAVWSRIGGLVRIGRATRVEEEQRRFEERQRVLEAIRSCQIRIRRLFGTPTGFSRELVATWTSHIPEFPTDNDINCYLDDVNDAVQAWIREETLRITKRLRDKPGFRSFVIGAKAVIQLGSGVAGALLTGGIHPSDLAVIPAVERMTAFLIERGLGYPYFSRCRTRLLAVRGAVLSSFLHARLLEPVRAAIPPGEQETARRLAQAVEAIPGPKDLLQ